MLKWAGGKTQLLDDILALLPARIETYYEPFVGGAAVFFALAARRRFRRAVLSDRNPDLVEVYEALRDDVEGVIQQLKRYRYSEEDYYRVRQQQPRKQANRAARTIYLNKTGYNGLYRVNRSGKFNVPFGRHKSPNWCDEDGLRSAARVLADADIRVGDFRETCRGAREGDAVYFDPPYMPVSRTANFTAYDRHPFGPEEHQRLAETFADLAARGVRVVLSNSDTQDTRALYGQWQIRTVEVARPINSRAEGRGPISEILVEARPARSRQRAHSG